MSSTKDFIDEVKGCLGGRSSTAERITYKNANFPQCKDVDAALDILFDKAHDASEDSGSGVHGKSDNSRQEDLFGSSKTFEG